MLHGITTSPSSNSEGEPLRAAAERDGMETAPSSQPCGPLSGSAQRKDFRPLPTVHMMPSTAEFPKRTARAIEPRPPLPIPHSHTLMRMVESSCALRCRTDSVTRSAQPAETHLLDIQDLRQSHAALASQLKKLTQRIDTENDKLSLFRQAQSDANDSDAVRRCLLFAKSRALATLRTGSSALGHIPPALFPANSVVQVVLKSQATDCTLREFCLLFNTIRNQGSTTCTFLPSEYAFRYPSATRTTRLDIQFHSYKAICDALEIDVLERSSAVYKERRDRSRVLRAVQVLGVDFTADGKRDIFLGRGASPGQLQFPVLHQDGAVWRGTTWETGFSIQIDRPPSSTIPISTLRPVNISAHTSRETYTDSTPLQFAITWKRLPGGAVYGSRPEHVPGLLHTLFPAARLLATSTQAIFHIPILNRLPSQLIAEGLPE